MARTRQEIEDRYRAAMEVANEYKEERPERYAELSAKAKDERADALGELADEAERAGAVSRVEAARSAVKAKYPKIAGLPGAFAGNTAEEIEANAAAANKFVEDRDKEVAEAGRVARRGRVAEAFSPSGRAVVPGSEIGQEAGQAEQSAAAVGRLARLREVAGTPAAADITREMGVAGKGSTPEEGVIAQLRAAGRMGSTSDEAFAGGKPRTGPLSEEDRRG
jgi:hypothetical protein